MMNNKTKRILFFTASNLNYYSSAMIRNLSILYGLLENQNELLVDIICKKNALNSSFFGDFEQRVRVYEISEKYFSDSLRKLKSGNLIKKSLFKSLRKLNNMLNFMGGNRKSLNFDVSKLAVKNYDVLITSSDPKISHYFYDFLISKSISVRTFVQYWGDPLLEDISNKSVVPKFIMKRIEKGILEKADIILYTSPYTLERQQEIYSNLSKKMFFFTNFLYKKENISTNTK